MVGPDLDPEALDALEWRMWSGIWKSAVPDLVASHGVEQRRFGPVQATIVADLPEAAWLNLVLGAATPGARDWGLGVGEDAEFPVPSP